MTQSQRLKFISYCQIIGIILVVFGHSFHEYECNGERGNTALFNLLHSFRMPLFVFVSGFLLVYTTIGRNKFLSIKDFTIYKFKRLLIPFLFLECLTFLPRTLLSNVADNTIAISWGNFAKSFLFTDDLSVVYLWFLQASFLMITFSYIIIIQCKRKAPLFYGVILSIAICLYFSGIADNIMFFSIGEAGRLYVFFCLGMIYSSYRDYINRFIPWNKPYLFFIFIVLWLSFYSLEGIVFSFISSIMGIAMIVSLCKIMVRHDIKVLNHLVGASYMIFLLSWYFNTLSQQILHHFTDFPWWIYTLLSFISGIYAPWIVYKLLMKYGKENNYGKYIAFVLGHKLFK